MATVAELTAERAALERDLAFLEKEFARLEQSGASRTARDNARIAIAETRAELALNATNLRNATAAARPVDNSGALVREEQQGRQENANPTMPPGPNLIQTSPDGRVIPPGQAQPTNARRATQDADSGTNAPVRPIASTQAVPPPTAQPTQGRPDAPTASRTPGVGAARQDSAARAGTVQGLKTVFLGSGARIVPQANSLGKYGSYTYNLSLYIMSKEDYQRTVSSSRISVPGSQLLIQSGGMPGSPATPTPSDSQQLGVTGETVGTKPTSAGRNQYFPLDFFIDDFTITNLQPGKGTGSANAVTNMKFKIIEPNGISFLDNLYSACEQYVGKKENYASQTYLMIIRFYGYDEKGNLVKVDNGTVDVRTDKNALVEKYIPFQFTKIGFRVANNLTEYNCEAVVPGNNQATGQSRGIIPYNTEIQAETIGGLFGGKASLRVDSSNITQTGREEIATESAQDGPGTSSPPPKANAAPKKTITGGLVDALNQFELDLVKAGTFTYPDQYEVIFPDPVISNAKTQPPGVVDKSKTGQPNPTTAGQAKNPATNSMNPTTQTKPSVAGMSIIQFIDQAVKTSTYIYEQQILQYNNESNQPIKNGNAPQLISWYRIGVQALPLQYDPKRNDYSYKITYSINPYLVNDVKSDFFNQSPFRGTHKKYSYWFTGENTEVLDYQQDFNNLYYVVVNGNTPPKNGPILDYRELAKRSYQTRSQESDQGQDGKVNEPAANAATSLYSPADLARVKLSIVGDPAWIAQGEIWRNIRAFSYTPFFPDGTINYEIQEPLFEIAWNKPVDYELTTGLMNPNQRTNGANQIETLANGPTQSYIYRAVSVTSSFKQGRFTQDLEGVLVQFPSTAIKQNDKPAEYDPYSSIPTEVPPGVNQRNATPAPAAATYPGAIANPNVKPTVVQPKNGAPALAPLNSTNTSAKPAKPAVGTSPAAKASAPVAQPLKNRPPTSGGQPVGNTTPATTTITSNAAGAATGIVRGRAAPVNTPPQNGAKDY
jgi:hypothetical protein